MDVVVVALVVVALVPVVVAWAVVDVGVEAAVPGTHWK